MVLINQYVRSTEPTCLIGLGRLTHSARLPKSSAALWTATPSLCLLCWRFRARTGALTGIFAVFRGRYALLIPRVLTAGVQALRPVEGLHSESRQAPAGWARWRGIGQVGALPTVDSMHTRIEYQRAGWVVLPAPLVVSRYRFGRNPVLASTNWIGLSRSTKTSASVVL